MTIFTTSFFIKTEKGISDNLLWISAIEFLPKHGQKHGEVYWSWGSTHHFIKVFISWILS